MNTAGTIWTPIANFQPHSSSETKLQMMATIKIPIVIIN
jgi:hypothetical protein